MITVRSNFGNLSQIMQEELEMGNITGRVAWSNQTVNIIRDNFMKGKNQAKESCVASIILMKVIFLKMWSTEEVKSNSNLDNSFKVDFQITKNMDKG